MNTEDLVDKLISSDLNEYIDILSDMSEHLEEVIFMLKNPDKFTENDKYNLLNVFIETCKIISSDNRGIGTLMKHLEI